MSRLSLIMVLIFMLNSCSSTKSQNIKKIEVVDVKKNISYKTDSCEDLRAFVDNHNFDKEALTKLHNNCPNQKSKVALLIAKGDKYEKNRDSLGASKSYQKALSLIDKNKFEMFEQYRFYLKNQIKRHSQQSNQVIKIAKTDSSVISSDRLEGYIMPRVKGETRDAMMGEFSTIKGIPLNFNSGSSQIEDGVNLTQAKEIGKLLSKKDYTNRVVYITGYTDTRGDNQSNQELSIQRANGLKSYLVSNFGLKENNIRAEGYGESFPICRFGEKQKVDREYSCSGKEDYSKSRRVTLEYGE
ncbi:OmpA family protein [Sulfurovum sp. bin170]|uniref:OmpA family protein n=1 Tax=Sulfurovum sp. bin170 TaxID=2695268 RepID=UPI0013E0BFD9|nr:OmpA family protein [Sulfurovum sp. bin170]NEW60055.1 OmpA family protein [Sulfurovum sp. bin170]